MKIVFLGSSRFSLPFLEALLLSEHEVQAVITRPDRPAGRGLNLIQTPVKELASAYRLNIHQPNKVNSEEGIKLLQSYKPDLLFVVAYGEILSQEVLDIPNLFSLNVHASLLPKFRGAAPINWALINNEKVTGITFMKMDECLDSGPIILQKNINIEDDDDALTLEDKLSRLGASCILPILAKIEADEYHSIPQDESGGFSFAPKLNKEVGKIEWFDQAHDIRNLIRGCIDWPGAFTYFKGKLLKIFKARVSKHSHLVEHLYPGTILNVSKNGIVVATGFDDLIIEELQLEGKKRMRVEEFITGNSLSAGESFTKER